MCVYVCVCECVRACVRACVRRSDKTVYYAVHAASPGQAGDSSPLLNAEPSWACAATQRCEPFKRDARRAGDKLEQTQTPRVVVAFHGRPEPLDHLVLVVVACHQPTRRLSSTLSSTGKESAPKIIITHTHTRLTALCPGLPGWAGTRKVKPLWI